MIATGENSHHTTLALYRNMCSTHSHMTTARHGLGVYTVHGPVYGALCVKQKRNFLCNLRLISELPTVISRRRSWGQPVLQWLRCDVGVCVLHCAACKKLKKALSRRRADYILLHIMWSLSRIPRMSSQAEQSVFLCTGPLSSTSSWVSG